MQLFHMDIDINYFLSKNESTTLVIKMDEQQVLKSIVNNCKTSDPDDILVSLFPRVFPISAHRASPS